MAPIAGVLAAASVAGAAMAATEAVDLELVIATDVSRSISHQEALLQRRGIAEAFRNPAVIRAIQSGFLRKIGVAYIDYSSRAFNRIVIDWTVVEGRESAESFASRLLAAPLTFGRRTSISDAIEMAREMIASNALEGTRRVIDVSGDGPNNFGNPVDAVRDATISRRITINGLPILNRADAFDRRFYLPDLDKYYLGCVIGGPGAFLVVAGSFEDFARAIRRKLVLEIAGTAPQFDRALSGHPIWVSSPGRLRPSPGGYVYPRGCDIGERMWNYWFNP
ncbi:MAG: DUF1194 domain-containing protein [Defluviicoccus sp.]|nr:DUF1194 domain-containing protein [Defluviicoccus sp.]MDE0384868.1 DUF1194 domain-containing protein [Defluviicoccus sp.]